MLNGEGIANWIGFYRPGSHRTTIFNISWAFGGNCRWLCSFKELSAICIDSLLMNCSVQWLRVLDAETTLISNLIKAAIVIGWGFSPLLASISALHASHFYLLIRALHIATFVDIFSNKEAHELSSILMNWDGKIDECLHANCECVLCLTT